MKTPQGASTARCSSLTPRFLFDTCTNTHKHTHTHTQHTHTSYTRRQGKRQAASTLSESPPPCCVAWRPQTPHCAVSLRSRTLPRVYSSAFPVSCSRVLVWLCSPQPFSLLLLVFFFLFPLFLYAGLWQTLYPFQQSAVCFAVQRQGKILLADEMGLGKARSCVAAMFMICVLLALLSLPLLSLPISLSDGTRQGMYLWTLSVLATALPPRLSLPLYVVLFSAPLLSFFFFLSALLCVLA
jgi:hypothetical protein